MLFPKTTLGRASSAFGWWREAAASYGISLEVVFFEDVVVSYEANRSVITIGGLPLSYTPDFAVLRGYEPEISLHFENRGVKVFNRWMPMMLSRDKVLTYQLLSKQGIAMPRTFRAFGNMSYADAMAHVANPVFILKATEGSCGENVFLVHDASEYASAVESCGGDFLIQEYIESSSGRDIRVWTVGGKAVAAVMRCSDSDFRSNFSCGGYARSVELTDDISHLAEAAAKAIGLDFAGVDILLGVDGPCVCEVNGNAGFRTLSTVGGPDILNLFFNFIDEEVYGKR